MKQLFSLITLILMSATAFAGDKGNGGFSVVCRDNAGAITSAEILDIYEGRILYKRTYPTDQKTVPELIKGAIEKLQDYSYFSGKLRKEILSIEKNTVFIPEGNELESTDDAFPPIKKTGCKFEQLANYTNAGEVLISQEIFDKLDNLNKAALILHEAIYSIRRKSVGDTTSQTTRRLVAQLLATNSDEAVIDRSALDSLYRPNNKQSCGDTGTLKEKIESCSFVQPEQFNLVLVTRTKELKEVWMDTAKKILWSDRIKENMTFDRALLACHGDMAETGFMSEYSWRLPTIEEFDGYGEIVLNVLSGMTGSSGFYWYWTSSFKGRSVKTFGSTEGQVGTNSRTNSWGSVRCVTPL
jgi:hypothetical protein